MNHLRPSPRPALASFTLHPSLFFYRQQSEHRQSDQRHGHPHPDQRIVVTHFDDMISSGNHNSLEADVGNLQRNGLSVDGRVPVAVRRDAGHEKGTPGGAYGKTNLAGPLTNFINRAGGRNEWRETDERRA